MGGKMGINKLSEIASVIDSLHKTPKYYESFGYPMVRCTDVKYGYLKLTDTLLVNEKIFAEFSRRYKPQENDIIITRVGSYGITALVGDNDFCLGQNTSAIVPKINPRYLYLALNSPQVKNQIEFSVVGSTQKTLSLKAINNLEIPRFGDAIEKKIASIGGDLDDKIDLNHQNNVTLEQISQAIFKSWFVDFEPVKAKDYIRKLGGNSDQIEKAAQAIIAGAVNLEEILSSSNLMDIEGQIKAKLDVKLSFQTKDQQNILVKTAKVFPDNIVESEMGFIPNGWECKALSEIIELKYGKALKKNNRKEGKIPVFGSGGEVGFHNEYLVKGPGIIVAKKGSVGNLFWTEDDFFPIDTTFFVSPIADIHLFWVYRQLCNIDILSLSSDSAVPGVNRNTLLSQNIVFPALSIIKIFMGFIAPFIHLKNNNQNEINSLSCLQNELLPRLLSGEITISEK